MTPDIYRILLNNLDEGKPAIVATRLESRTNGDGLTKMIITKDNKNNKYLEENFDENIRSNIDVVFDSGKIQLVEDRSNGKVLLEPFYPPPRLIVLGGGHIAVPLVEFASRCGFEITVVDDRPAFANPERFPGARTVICDSFENSFHKIKLNMSCFVVIVTRGHRHDMVCLTNVMKHETAYAGMIGSKRRVAIVKQNLLDNGFEKERLDKLNAPIGLPIGAITPEEIAVSILGQVIAARRIGKTVLDDSAATIKGKSLEFDVEVIEELAADTQEPKAVVTIVATKGSSPRHSGAKMLVYPDGRILGSIGGGCSESEVVLIARDLMNDGGGWKMHKVDMTDDAAEEEGMVCGGTMEVLIEA